MQTSDTDTVKQDGKQKVFSPHYHSYHFPPDCYFPGLSSLCKYTWLVIHARIIKATVQCTESVVSMMHFRFNVRGGKKLTKILLLTKQQIAPHFVRDNEEADLTLK